MGAPAEKGPGALRVRLVSTLEGLRELEPVWDSPIELHPDVDAIEALQPEREALWRRLEQASFLSDDEKRAAVGYGRD